MAMGAQAWWMHERCMTSEEVTEHAELVKSAASERPVVHPVSGALGKPQVHWFGGKPQGDCKAPEGLDQQDFQDHWQGLLRQRILALSRTCIRRLSQSICKRRGKEREDTVDAARRGGGRDRRDPHNQAPACRAASI